MIDRLQAASHRGPNAILRDVIRVNTGRSIKSYNDLIPRDGIPAATGPASRQLDWFDGDTRERYREKGSHALYGERDIQYRFNSLGYRSAEFDEPADIRVIAVGCSYVHGVGLPEDALFHQRFAERLRSPTRTVAVFNLGLPATSNDYINRILQLAVPHLDPHIVLVNFTHADRREYVSVQNHLMAYLPAVKPTDFVSRELKSHFDALISPLDNCLNLFRNYRAVASLLADRCWLFSTIDPDALGGILDHVDPTRYAGPMDILDKARDRSHPGAESHAALEKLYWETFSTLRQEAGNFDWE